MPKTKMIHEFLLKKLLTKPSRNLIGYKHKGNEEINSNLSGWFEMFLPCIMFFAINLFFRSGTPGTPNTRDTISHKLMHAWTCLAIPN